MVPESVALLTRAQSDAGISQREWSRRTGIVQPQINRYLRGDADPSSAQLARLLAAVGKRLVLVDGPTRNRERERQTTRELFEVLALVDHLPRRAPGPLTAKPFRELVRHG